MADQGNIAPLISQGYREAQETLHEQDGYGVASTYYGALVGGIVEQTGAAQLLDYGAGKGRLAHALAPYIHHEIEITRYDPAIPEFSEAPDPCEMVACIDVLEHIEPDCLDAVLDDLKRVTQRVGLFTIATGPAIKTLPDGRNAHLIQEGIEFWLPRLWERFHVKSYQDNGGAFWVIVES